MAPKGIAGRRVLFGTPTFDKSLSVDYHTSMLGTVGELIRHGVACDSHIIAGLQFIDLARNRIVAAFLKSEATDLIFVDADQGWDPEAVPRILGHEELIVAALPPKKCDPPEFHSNALTGKIQNGLFESREAGTGFMRIRRDAFAALDAAYPDLAKADRENAETPYFQTGIHAGGFLGEDMFFCRLWTGMGESLWIDPDVTFTHRGSKAWKGNFYEHAVGTGMLKSA